MIKYATVLKCCIFQHTKKSLFSGKYFWSKHHYLTNLYISKRQRFRVCVWKSAVIIFIGIGLKRLNKFFFILDKGLLFQVGDIVSTFDIEGEVFFAQLRGFLQDDYCEKFCVVTWLIPKIPQPKVFDPMLFLPGKKSIYIFSFWMSVYITNVDNTTVYKVNF